MRASSRACSYSWQPWEELQPPHTVALTDSVDILTTPYTYHCQWKEGKGRLKKGANDTNGTQAIKAQCTHSHSERLQARISLTQTTPKLHLVPIFHYTVSRNSILWRKKGQNTFKFQVIEKLKPQKLCWLYRHFKQVNLLWLITNNNQNKHQVRWCLLQSSFYKWFRWK